MKVQIRHIVDHLVWSTSGTVWAIWWLTPTGSRYMSDRTRDDLHARIASLVRSLPGSARLYGLCARVDPAEVVAQTVEGVDYHRHAAWAEVADAQLRLLAGEELDEPVEMHRRTLWLAVPLAADGARAQWSAGIASVWSELSGVLGVAPAPVAAREVDVFQEQAARLEAELGGAVQLRRARPAEIVWMHQHAVARGLDGELLGEAEHCALRGSRLEHGTLRSPSHADLGHVRLLPFGVDWVVDMTLVSAEKVVAAVTRKKRDLVDQAEQYAARRATGLPEAMHDAADDLGDLSARASRTSVEVEVQTVAVMTVWGSSPAECDQRASALQARLRGANYRLVRPVGGQEELFTLGLPAATTPPATRQYVQHQLGEDWAMHGALAGQSFGDPTGAMVGFSQDIGTASPVLLDIAEAPAKNASASLGFAGDLGGGKSTLLKLISSSVVDRGGRVIAIDRTKSREWARFARAAAEGRCQVVDAASAELSIDPLRVFADPSVGARYALSYLTVQLGVGPMTEHGALLKTAVKQAASSDTPCMAGVLTALEEMAAQDSGRGQRADALAEWLRVAADEPLAATVFAPALPPLDLMSAVSSDFVVITTTGLTLPPRDAATNPELLRGQPLEALIGRAVLYLIAAIARETAFTDPRFTFFPLDEAYWLTSSAEGQALIDEIVYDGRKHGAGTGLGCHDVDELGTSTTRGLLAYRFLARTAAPTLAARGLNWLGLDGSNEDLVSLVTTDLSPFAKTERAGEFLARDPRMAIGRFKVLVPDVERILAGIFTTPTTTTITEPATAGSTR